MGMGAGTRHLTEDLFNKKNFFDPRGGVDDDDDEIN